MLFSFVACSNGDDAANPSGNDSAGQETDTGVTVPENNNATAAQYAVGSSITLDDGVEYIIVDNPAASSSLTSNASLRSASRAAALSDEEAQLLVKAKSVEKAISLAHEYFEAKSLVAIRTAGKITVPSAEAEAEYSETKAVIAAAFPQDTAESEYYAVNTVSGNNMAYYRDIYYAVSLSGDTFTKIGQIETIWNEQASSSFTLDDGTTVKLRELLKNGQYNPAAIRRQMPSQFKMYRYEAGVASGIKIHVEDYYDSGNFKRATQDFNYYRAMVAGKAKIVPSLTVLTNFADSEERTFKSTSIELLGGYGNEVESPCLKVNVSSSNGKYYYWAKGSSNTNPVTETSHKEFSFQNGKYTAEDYIDASRLSFGTECTLYDGKPYNRDALLIPVDFVLNDDGTVSMGENMDAWAKRWWQFVIANNEGATTLEGTKETYTEPDYVATVVTVADILVASTNDETDGVSFTIKVPSDGITQIKLQRRPSGKSNNDVIEANNYGDNTSTKINFVKDSQVTFVDEFVTKGTACTYTVRFKTEADTTTDYILGTITPAKGSGELNTADDITLSYDDEQKQLTLTKAATFAESAITNSQQIRVRYKCEDNTTIEYQLMNATSFNILSDKNGVIEKKNLYGKEMTFNQFILSGRKEQKKANTVDFVYYQYYDTKNKDNSKITLDGSAETITLPAKSAESE